MAHRLSVTERTIYNMIQRGQLERREMNGRVWVRTAMGDTMPIVIPNPTEFDEDIAEMVLENTSEILLQDSDFEVEPIQKRSESVEKKKTATKQSGEADPRTNGDVLDRIEYLHDELRVMAVARERAVSERDAATQKLETMEQEVERLRASLEELRATERSLRKELGCEREISNLYSLVAKLGWMDRGAKKRFIGQAEQMRRALPSS
ncbi:MAG: hypothetical protein CMH54_16015 [Myxococcales bacterium]|nr:hypothetical protein [Myxococcales bacterium]